MWHHRLLVCLTLQRSCTYDSPLLPPLLPGAAGGTEPRPARPGSLPPAHGRAATAWCDPLVCDHTPGAATQEGEMGTLRDGRAQDPSRARGSATKEPQNDEPEPCLQGWQWWRW